MVAPAGLDHPVSMGPYCQFCGQRCFLDPGTFAGQVPKADWRIWFAAGQPLLATCRPGKAFDRMRIGINADDVQAGLWRKSK